MKSHQDSFTLRASVVAVRGALLTLALLPVAHAADVAAQAADAGTPQMVRSSTVEVGASYVSQDSFKAGEYTGMEKKGLTVDANIGLHGGDADSATRWNVMGTDLGLETRNLQVDGGEQGRFRVNFGYDEILRNRSDSYQTPLIGAGTNTLTLPATWIAPTLPRVSAATINARGLSSTVTGAMGMVTTPAVVGPPAVAAHVDATAPTTAQLATAAALQAADLPAFHNVDLYTKRKAYNGGVSFDIDPRWQVAVSAKHEDKDGMKPMGTVTRANAEVSTIIPDLIDQRTDQFNASLGYKDDKSFMKLAYYGSLFKNNVNSMKWSDYSVNGGTTQLQISSAPSNEFHKLGLTGGYDFSPVTKLVASGSYARNTQNEQFVTDPTDFFVPVTSLNGLVVTKAIDLKLTSRPIHDLSLVAGYKYNDRDNRTPVNIYGFTDAQNPIAGTSAAPNASFATAINAMYPNLAPVSFAGNTSGNFNLNANRPYSKKVNAFNLDADYKVAQGETVAAGFDWDKTDNYCNGSWIACADAAKTDEKTWKAEWRANIHEDINARIAYEYSKRTVDYNEDAFLAIVPMANVVPTGVAGVTQSAYQYLVAQGLTGYGPVAGFSGAALTGPAGYYMASNNALANAAYANANRISELIGMRRYNMADRNRDKLRSSINWQANEKLALQGGFSYNQDDYANSTYGLRNAKDFTLNLEADYAASETLSLSAFVTHEDKKSRNAGNSYTANSTAANVNGFTAISGGCYATIAARNAANKIDPCLDWTMNTHDQVDTLGLTFQKSGLMADKLSLAGDVSLSRAKTDIGGNGGNYVNNPLAVAGAAAGTVAAYFVSAQDLPTVTTNIIDLRLNGKYTLDKQQSVHVGYAYQYMKAVDWAYDGMQVGGLAGGLPTNEQAPAYKVHTVAVSYLYTFK